MAYNLNVMGFRGNMSYTNSVSPEIQILKFVKRGFARQAYGSAPGCCYTER